MAASSGPYEKDAALSIEPPSFWASSMASDCADRVELSGPKTSVSLELPSSRFASASAWLGVHSLPPMANRGRRSGLKLD